MQRSNGWTILSFIILLGIVGLSMLQAGHLGRQISTLKAELDLQEQDLRDLDALRRQILALQTEVRELAEAQSWASTLEVTPIGYGERTIGVVLSWLLKEYTQGSEVTLYWQEPGAAEFRPLKAEPVGLSEFEVRTEIPLVIWPAISLSWQRPGGIGGAQAKDAGVTSIVDGDQVSSQEYRYYVSMKTGDQVKSTDVKTVDLSKLSLWATAALSVDINHSANDVTVTVKEEPQTVPHAAFRLERVSLEGTTGDKVVFTRELSTIGTQDEFGLKVPVFQVTIPGEESKSETVWLEAEFQGGRVVRRPMALQF